MEPLDPLLHSDRRRRALQRRPALQSWTFPSGAADPTQELDAVDIFGDGSAFALSVSGKIRGRTAYLVRTTYGPVLLIADTSHTRCGWEHDVETGGSSMDRTTIPTSLLHLKDLVARHPQHQVLVGHQP